MRTLRLSPNGPCRRLVGVGGVGTGIFFALEGSHDLGRNESRMGRLLDVRDYCKLHIISHYIAVLLGARKSGKPFHVLPVARVGNDERGRRMIAEMAQAGMDTRYVKVDPKRPTLFSVCFQYPDGAGGNITTSDSAAAALSRRDVEEAKRLLSSRGGGLMVLAAPEAPLGARVRLLKLATRAGAFRAASLTTGEIPAARQLGMFSMLDLLSVNQEEAGALLGKPFDPAAPWTVLERRSKLPADFHSRARLVVTAGGRGAWGFDLALGEWDFCPAPRVRVASTAGGGDALLGGLIGGEAVGMPFIHPAAPRQKITDRPLSSALDFAVLLASLTVTSPHTIHPEANLDTLVKFARAVGVTFAPHITATFGLRTRRKGAN
jgi:sugar/nucleoside kinase (ribokinase family)